MNHEKMQAETDVSAEKEQQELSAQDNIDTLLTRINHTKNPKAILQSLTIIKPFIKHSDNNT